MLWGPEVTLFLMQLPPWAQVWSWTGGAGGDRKLVFLEERGPHDEH